MKAESERSNGPGSAGILAGEAVSNSVHALLSAAIDYAGLFPPTTLPMSQAVASYAAYRAGEQAWALGRFIVPVARLEEFADAFHPTRSSRREEAPIIFPERSEPPHVGCYDLSSWRLSALVGADMAGDIAKAAAFNQLHEGAAIIDTLELKAATADSIRDTAKLAKGRFVSFHEIPIAEDPREFLAAIARAGGRAKIRTGGVTGDAIPEPRALARFLEQCAAARVPFKATAGLHHPIRGAHPLTGEADGPTATMHGFVNVFLAAAFARAGWSAAQLGNVLDEQSLSAFGFGPEAASWRGHRLAIAALQASRMEFLISFGSCSFEEPIAELQALGWL